MSLIILTKSPTINILSLDFFKSVLRLLLRRARGPKAVTGSLLRGLQNLKAEFSLNYHGNFKKDDIVFVNENISALKFAVGLKKNGKIRKLVAGPNFVINPNDRSAIMRSPEIDILLFPCEWVKNYWLSIAPELEHRYAIWPAGVANRGDLKTNGRDMVLVYYKNCPLDLFNKIVRYLDDHEIKFKIIRYGYFKQKEYFNLLEKSRTLIYLSGSESQGIAMFEAWERGVPTFVWNQECVELDGKKYSNVSSSPYLSAEAGAFFKNEDEFKAKILNFLEKSGERNPREYILKNFTDELCARKFLDIIR
ncbi:MAG: hypothetical protein M0Q92_13320 [Methanoregula sp.]|jgi:hypothetical protein|nr:hypothetical protein [Methanoregula sp.]